VAYDAIPRTRGLEQDRAVKIIQRSEPIQPDEHWMTQSQELIACHRESHAALRKVQRLVEANGEPLAQRFEHGNVIGDERAGSLRGEKRREQSRAASRHPDNN
jgi:hypothetical protein